MRDRANSRRAGIAWLGGFSLVLILSGCAMLPDHLHDVKTGHAVATENIVRSIGDPRVIFVGEAHDNPTDHLLQLEVIRQLHESGRPLAVALEVFPATLQPALDAWVAGRLSEYEFARIYYSSWSVFYGYYADIFSYAKEQGIPLVGLNITPDKIQSLLENGPENEPREVLEALRYSDCTREVEYSDAMLGYWHLLGHGRDFLRMCNTRRFKEAVMAYTIERVLHGSDRVLVVLVGSVHAQRNAVPEMLKRRGIGEFIILLPGTMTYLTGSRITPQQGDLTW